MNCYFNIGPPVLSKGPSSGEFWLPRHAIAWRSSCLFCLIAQQQLSRLSEEVYAFFSFSFFSYRTIKSSRCRVSYGIISMIIILSLLRKDLNLCQLIVSIIVIGPDEAVNLFKLNSFTYQVFEQFLSCDPNGCRLDYFRVQSPSLCRWTSDLSTTIQTLPVSSKVLCLPQIHHQSGSLLCYSLQGH